MNEFISFPMQHTKYSHTINIKQNNKVQLVSILSIIGNEPTWAKAYVKARVNKFI